MENKRMFSVIVPVYGVAEYLRDCIDSVLNQSYENYELILVDDGSKDGSGFICDEYAKIDSRIKVIHKENGGLVSARKAGAREALGEYIICLDGDDFVGKDYLKNFNDTIKNTGAEIVMDGCVWWTNDAKYSIAKVSDGYYGVPLKEGFYDRNRMEKEIFPDLVENKYSKNIQNSVWGKAFKKEIYVPIQLAVSDYVHMGEDICVVKPCITKANSFAVNANAEYFYRQIESSMTRNPKSYKWDAPEIISLHLEKNISVQEYDFQQQIYRNCVHLLFNVCRVHKSFSGIKKDYYRKAIKEARFSFGSKGWFARLILSIML